jgi:hypothetical protein
MGKTEQGFDDPYVVMVTPTKLSKELKAVPPPPSIHEFTDFYSDSSSTSSPHQHERQCGTMKEFLLDALTQNWSNLKLPNPGTLLATMAFATFATNFSQEQTLKQPQVASLLSPIEHTASLIDHSASKKTKAQKKQEKKERKIEIKRERQEVQQLLLLEKQEREIDEKLASAESPSALWSATSKLVDTVLSATDPFVAAYEYAATNYLEDESHEQSYERLDNNNSLEDDEEDFDDDFSFDKLDAVTIKKSKLKKSAIQNAAKKKKKKKNKKNKPKLRGRRADYEEAEEGIGEEIATDEVLTMSSPPKKNVAERVEAIFSNKELIFKDFDDFIDKTVAEMKIENPSIQDKRTLSKGRKSRDIDGRGRLHKSPLHKSPSFAHVPTLQNKKINDGTAVIAQSIDHNIEIVLANTSKSLLNRRDALQSGYNKSSAKQKRLHRRCRSSEPNSKHLKDKGARDYEDVSGYSGHDDRGERIDAAHKKETSVNGDVNRDPKLRSKSVRPKVSRRKSKSVRDIKQVDRSRNESHSRFRSRKIREDENSGELEASTPEKIKREHQILDLGDANAKKRSLKKDRSKSFGDIKSIPLILTEVGRSRSRKLGPDETTGDKDTPSQVKTKGKRATSDLGDEDAKKRIGNKDKRKTCKKDGSIPLGRSCSRRIVDAEKVGDRETVSLEMLKETRTIVDPGDGGAKKRVAKKDRKGGCVQKDNFDDTKKKNGRIKKKKTTKDRSSIVNDSIRKIKKAKFQKKRC